MEFVVELEIDAILVCATLASSNPPGLESIALTAIVVRAETGQSLYKSDMRPGDRQTDVGQMKVGREVDSPL